MTHLTAHPSTPSRAISVLVLALSISLIGQSAIAAEKKLSGSMFVTLARGNTFIGQFPNGVDFHAYFLGGGVATFVDENNIRDTGRWRIGENDALCVTWRRMNQGEERCATLFIDGKKLRLEGNTEIGAVEFVGSIIDSFD